MSFSLVIGAGPAGLMAAEELALAGRRVMVAEAKPTPARKFLMAGKSGLNITKAEDSAVFAAHYDAGWLAPILAEFGPHQVQDWCRAMGQPVFTGSSGRVFPVAMKASPLLRAWLTRLAGRGVELRTRWRWQGWQGDQFVFQTPKGQQLLSPDVTVLALGGASWQRLGSDAAWVPWLREKGVEITPFQGANVGYRVDWSPHMTRFFGAPVKGVALHAGTQTRRGEFVISARGLEGGGVYAISKALRDGAELCLDLMPDVASDVVAKRLAAKRSKDSIANRLRKLGLSAVAIALLQEFGRPLTDAHLPALIKALPIPLQGPRPMDEAISVAGGITLSSLTDGLELRAMPHVFACGEMLDWEAPTGGYLLTACLATGRWAGRAAASA